MRIDTLTNTISLSLQIELRSEFEAGPKVVHVLRFLRNTRDEEFLSIVGWFNDADWDSNPMVFRQLAQSDPEANVEEWLSHVAALPEHEQIRIVRALAH